MVDKNTTKGGADFRRVPLRKDGFLQVGIVLVRVSQWNHPLCLLMHSTMCVNSIYRWSWQCSVLPGSNRVVLEKTTTELCKNPHAQLLQIIPFFWHGCLDAWCICNACLWGVSFECPIGVVIKTTVGSSSEGTGTRIPRFEIFRKELGNLNRLGVGNQPLSGVLTLETRRLAPFAL
jgi:hypothetical protein